MTTKCLCPCRGKSQPSVFRKRRGRSTGLPSADGRGARRAQPRESKSLRRPETNQRPPPLQQGPRRRSIRCLSACPVGSRRTARGARSASDYSANLTRKVKVLDFIKSGGPILTIDRTIFEMWLVLAGSSGKLEKARTSGPASSSREAT